MTGLSPSRLLRIEKPRNFDFEVLERLQFALPDNQKVPPQRFQLGLLPEIPLAITLEFGTPKIQARFWHAGQFAGWIGVAMPEAAVHEDGFASAAKYEVGGAREAAVVQPVTKAHRVQETADEHLRFAVAPSDPRHSGATLIGSERIHRII